MRLSLDLQVAECGKVPLSLESIAYISTVLQKFTDDADVLGGVREADDERVCWPNSRIKFSK